METSIVLIDHFYFLTYTKSSRQISSLSVQTNNYLSLRIDLQGAILIDAIFIYTILTSV